MKSPFQTIIVIVFCAAFVVAVMVFSGMFGGGFASRSDEPQGLVIAWGVLPQAQMEQYFKSFNAQGLDYFIEYHEHAPERFADDLVRALADEVQPDLVFVSSEIFSQFEDKLYVIPYEVFTERMYRDANIDGAQIFLTSEGVVSIPLVVDPLVVYYNKDMLAARNFVTPPTTWLDIAAAVPTFLQRDARGNITRAAIALGEGDNVNHARDILSALFLQTGSPIITNNGFDGSQIAVLDQEVVPDSNVIPTIDALNFYLGFSDATSSTYSWNRALPSSFDMFTAGRLAFYIGRASELFQIQASNPNLNFDVTNLFSPQEAIRPITYGSFVGVSVLERASNFTAAYAAVGVITSDQQTDALSKILSLPPTRRNLLLVQQSNPYVSVFFKAALSAFSWPDPNFVATKEIFRDMIRNITSGASDAYAAVSEANRDLQDNIR